MSDDCVKRIGFRDEVGEMVVYWRTQKPRWDLVILPARGLP